jgi:hypothetical protein
MGYSTALDLAGLERGLEYHLAYNHYPPVPLDMVEPCKAAIAAYHEEDYDRDIELPSPITWRGQGSAPASAIVDAHHLRAFIESEDL